MAANPNLQICDFSILIILPQCSFDYSPGEVLRGILQRDHQDREREELEMKAGLESPLKTPGYYHYIVTMHGDTRLAKYHDHRDQQSCTIVNSIFGPYFIVFWVKVLGNSG